MRRILSFFILFFGLIKAQEYSDYRIRYDHFEGNDPRAFQYIKPYVEKAKKAKNYHEQFQAYKDAIHFSPTEKLSYADSAVSAALHTKNPDIIGSAYLTKGTVFYFNYRKFQPALNEYLKAWKYLQSSSNPYLYYKNLYHIGVVKSYLGNSAEALEIFKKCDHYFVKEPISDEAPNRRYNRIKGYLNNLHQTAKCLLELSRAEEAKILIEKGIRMSATRSDFYLERSYFYQLKGICAYLDQRDSDALGALDTSLAGLEKKNDFTQAAVVYYYKGKIYARLGQDVKAVNQFNKIDSIFSTYNFVIPEIRQSYEYLIKYYHENKDREKELYYNGQLLKADRLMESDFKYLMSKIHKDYDTGDLLAAKNKLEHSVSSLYTIGWLTGFVAIVVFGFLLYRNARKSKSDLAPVQNLQFEINGKRDPKPQPNLGDHPKVPDAVAIAVLAKLENLERKNFFLQKGMSLHKLAPLLHTNTNYLSMIIKEHRGCHFNAYIKQQRIAFITNKLRESKLWRNYSLETLASEGGFGDRTNFSNAFFEYNQMKPLDFIRQLDETSSEEV